MLPKKYYFLFWNLWWQNLNVSILYLHFSYKTHFVFYDIHSDWFQLSLAALCWYHRRLTTNNWKTRETRGWLATIGWQRCWYKLEFKKNLKGLMNTYRNIILKIPKCCKTPVLPQWQVCCYPCRQGPQEYRVCVLHNITHTVWWRN